MYYLMMTTLRQPKRVAGMCKNICCVFDCFSPFLYDLSPKINFMKFRILK